jgi:hypothetical protein
MRHPFRDGLSQAITGSLSKHELPGGVLELFSEVGKILLLSLRYREIPFKYR